MPTSSDASSTVLLPSTPAVPTSMQLDDEVLGQETLLILSWLSRGHSVRRIQQLAANNKFSIVPAPATILELRNKFSAHIDAARNAEADITSKYGIAKKEERIRRFQELADELEHQVFDLQKFTPQLTRELRAVYEAVREETAPRSGYSPKMGDEWYQLLQSLQPKPALTEPTPTPTNSVIENSNSNSNTE